jgi:hypothetical protein
VERLKLPTRYALATAEAYRRGKEAGAQAREATIEECAGVVEEYCECEEGALTKCPACWHAEQIRALAHDCRPNEACPECVEEE